MRARPFLGILGIVAIFFLFTRESGDSRVKYTDEGASYLAVGEPVPGGPHHSKLASLRRPRIRWGARPARLPSVRGRARTRTGVNLFARRLETIRDTDESAHQRMLMALAQSTRTPFDACVEEILRSEVQVKVIFPVR